MTPSSRVGRGCAHGERAGEADLGLCGWHCPHRPHLGLVVRTGSVLLRPVPALGFVWRSPSGRGLGCGSRGPERFGAQGAGMRFCTLRAVRAAPATCPQEEAIGFVRAVPNEQNCPLLHEPFPSFLPSPNAASPRSREREVACAAPRGTERWWWPRSRHPPGTGSSSRPRGPAEASAAGSTAAQGAVRRDLPSCLFPLQVKGAPRKLEAGPFLTEEERRLAQDEYVEDSSDEEVGPAAKHFVVLVVVLIWM